MKWRRFADIGGGYPAALLAVALVTLLAFPWRAYLPTATVTLLYVPVIIGAARLWGLRVSGLAAIAAFIATDFVFVEPYYRLSIASASEWIGLIVFLVVALISGQQTARLRESERAALKGQDELELLNRLSSRMASEKSTTAVAEFTVGQLTSVLGASRAALYATSGDEQPPTCLAASGSRTDEAEERLFVDWVLTSNKAIGLAPPGTTARAQIPASVPADAALSGKLAEGVYIPLQTSDSLEGVLHIRLPVDPQHDVALSGLLAAIANLGATSLERHRLEVEASKAEALYEADRLKSTLVSSVSHELKTPLAAATARVTGLVDEIEDCAPARARQELLAVADDLDRLNGSIGDLIDFSRLESEEWRPSFEPYDVADVLGTVLDRIAPDERARLEFDLQTDLPQVDADFAQLAMAFYNLVENALMYSPSGSTVSVTARAAAGEVRVTIEDRGQGVAEDEKDAVFEKFYRGVASAAAPGGTGLGLTIAAEIVRTHKGRIWIEDATPTGARFVVSLPEAGQGRQAVVRNARDA